MEKPKSHSYRTAVIACTIVFFICAKSVATDDGSTMVYRYWDLKASQNRDQYQFELLKLALEKTRKAYGDYELIRVDKKITSLRASREVSRGEIINIEAAPNWTTDNAPSELRKDQRIAVKIPILQGLLGYRRLVIRKKDFEKFNHITDASQLQQLVAGQGKDWEDVFIYRANGYQVNDEANYYNLFAMLVAGRFDYLPLSAIEAEDFVQKFGQYSHDVMIAPDILIYYPFPVLFQVSIHHPGLAQRVEKGLIQARADGSMDKLFRAHFSTEITKLRTTRNRTFILENKRVPTELRLAEPILVK